MLLNQTIIVGRLVADPEIKETENGKSVCNITLAVPRTYKNVETGEYDTDFIDCTLWEGIAKSTTEYCKKGDVVGVKARLAITKREIADKNYNFIQVVAEKISFINTK